MTQEKTNSVLISGKTATGKSASLEGLKKPKGVLYLNCENKRLPFKHEFKNKSIADPYQIDTAFDWAETKPDIHTITIDTITFMMDMLETMYVINAVDTQKMWGEYAQFFKRLMFEKVAASTKNIIFMAHTDEIVNKAEMTSEIGVKVKGSLMARGIESFFATVVSTKRVSTKSLKDFKSPLLTITPDEELDGFKYVFQTRLTKATVDERIRGPVGMWARNETFIDNNAQLIVNRLHEFYK